MISQKVVVACQDLFHVKSFVASGILPALRIEDAKIALFKRLHGRNQNNENQKAVAFMQSYDIVARYIAANAGNTRYSPTGADGAPSSDILFYSGKIPLRNLRLGSYLYYKGVISHSTLKESLSWQKEKRALFGQIAMQTGVLKTEDFAQIMLAVKKGDCFGSVARKSGMISEEKINSILEIQKMYNCKIGTFFIKKGCVSAERLKLLEDERQAHNARFGDGG